MRSKRGGCIPIVPRRKRSSRSCASRRRSWRTRPRISPPLGRDLPPWRRGCSSSSRMVCAPRPATTARCWGPRSTRSRIDKKSLSTSWMSTRSACWTWSKKRRDRTRRARKPTRKGPGSKVRSSSCRANWATTTSAARIWKVGGAGSRNWSARTGRRRRSRIDWWRCARSAAFESRRWKSSAARTTRPPARSTPSNANCSATLAKIPAREWTSCARVKSV